MMRRAQGFTLVEVVIALTLIALIMLGLVGAMRAMGDASAKVASVSGRIGDLQLIDAFLRRTIAGAENLQVRERAGDEHAREWFEGRGAQLRWVGNLGYRHGVAGMHLLELSIDPTLAPEPALVLEVRPYPGVGKAADQSPALRHLLVGKVEELRFAYQGADPDGPWLESWKPDDEGGLPLRVRMQLRVDGRYWPEMIYPIAPL